MARKQLFELYTAAPQTPNAQASQVESWDQSAVATIGRFFSSFLFSTKRRDNLWVQQRSAAAAGREGPEGQGDFGGNVQHG